MSTVQPVTRFCMNTLYHKIENIFLIIRQNLDSCKQKIPTAENKIKLGLWWLEKFIHGLEPLTEANTGDLSPSI